MTILSRFFGRRPAADSGALPFGLAANPACKDGVGLQVLFKTAEPYTAAAVEAAMRAYHPSMAKARCETDPTLSAKSSVFGLAGFGKHIVRLVGFDLPMPAEAVEACVAPSHYAEPLKAEARGHAAHILLYYAGWDDSPLEQYVALALVAGALTRLGATTVLNEGAKTSLPALFFDPAKVEGDITETLRTMPLTMLFCGFVKYMVEGTPGVWMRTYGANRFGLPDFAALAAGHDEGSRYFGVFNNVFGYLLKTGATLEPGHTMQLGADEFFRLRAPVEREYFLQSEGRLLVAEIVTAREINR